MFLNRQRLDIYYIESCLIQQLNYFNSNLEILNNPDCLAIVIFSVYFNVPSPADSCYEKCVPCRRERERERERERGRHAF